MNTTLERTDAPATAIATFLFFTLMLCLIFLSDLLTASKSLISRSLKAAPEIGSHAKAFTLATEPLTSKLTALMYLVPMSNPIMLWAFFLKSDFMQ